MSAFVAFLASVFTFGCLLGTGVDAGNGPSVRFEQSRYRVNEGDVLYFRLIALGTFSFNFSVNVSLVPRTAELKEDFVPLPDVEANFIMLHFRVGSTFSTYGNISIVANIAWELTETFRLRIVAPPGITVVAPRVANVVIMDTNQVDVSFQRESYVVREEDGGLSFALLARGVYTTGFTVSVTCLELNPIEAVIGSRSGSDEVDVRGRVHVATFDDVNAANTTSSEITLVIVDDDVAEPTESFICAILRPFGTNGVVVSDPDTITVSIRDDDLLSVQFPQSLYEGTEDGSVQLRLEALQNFTQPFSARIFPFTLGVDHQFKSVEADPEDYVFEEESTVFFDANERLSTSVTVQLPSDRIFEYKEYFGVSFTLNENGGGSSLNKMAGPQSTTLVSISDKESKLFLRFEKKLFKVTPKEKSIDIVVEVVEEDPDSPSAYKPANHSVEFKVDLFAKVQKSKGSNMVFKGRNHSVTFFPGNTTSTPLTLPVTTDIQEYSVDMALPELEELEGRIEILESPATIVIQVEGEVVTAVGNLTFVNDTIIGDPLYTIPLPHNQGEFPELEGVSLCMEFRGFAGQYYNLVSDECTTVNAHYTQGVANPQLHVIDEIGVKTEGVGGVCHEVRVQLENCQTFVDGTETIGTYRADGVTVMAVAGRNCTRITVPNCAPGKELVMWVMCDQIGVGGKVDGMLQFTLSRAVGLAPTSHGLVGQFWNVPINYTKFAGRYDDVEVTTDDDVYAVTIEHPGSHPRTFLSVLHPRIWDKSLRSCLYAGNSLGGASRGGRLHSSVVEGKHLDYEMTGILSDTFKFSRFAGNC